MDTQEISVTDVVRAIAGGKFDDHISTLFESLNNRNRALHTIQAAEIRSKIVVGSKIRTKNISPQYLSGYEGVVTGFDGKWVVIDVSAGGIRPKIRRYNAANMKVTASCLDIL